MREKQISYGMFICNLRCFMCLFACTVFLLLINFLDSILSVQLNVVFGLSSDTVGYIFSIPFFIYILGCPVVNYISDRLIRRVTILVGLLVATISVFMTGPSEVLL